jgi:uncharacterized oxidoreductase
MLSVLIDPAAFGDADAIVREAQAFGAYVKGSPPAPGVDAVRLPGEPEQAARADRLTHGIAVEDMSMEQLRAAAPSVGLDPAALEPEVESA